MYGELNFLEMAAELNDIRHSNLVGNRSQSLSVNPPPLLSPTSPLTYLFPSLFFPFLSLTILSRFRAMMLDIGCIMLAEPHQMKTYLNILVQNAGQLAQLLDDSRDVVPGVSIHGHLSGLSCSIQAVLNRVIDCVRLDLFEKLTRT